MSLEELQADFATNTQAIKAIDPALATTGDVMRLIRDTIWPFQENLVNEMVELKEDIQDLVDGIEDILHAETAGIIAAPIYAAKALFAKFAPLITGKEDLKALKEWGKVADQALLTISEIVVADEDDDEDDDADDDDTDDDAPEQE